MYERWFTSNLSQAIQCCNKQYDYNLGQKRRFPDMFVIKMCDIYYVLNPFEMHSMLINAAPHYIVYSRQTEKPNRNYQPKQTIPDLVW